ncbi:MAG: hypothetical protein COB08_005095 [Rhodobacteraceae bacterium]|nr:hypothetical protein [Paracoccaceae bacterium]
MAEYFCADCNSTETLKFTPDCCSYCGGPIVETPSKTRKKFRVVATSLVTYSAVVEAESEEQAGEIAFNQDNTSWEEIGDADWQIDRVEPFVGNQPEPLNQINGMRFSELLTRQTHLLKLIDELSETMKSGFLPPHAAQELTGRRNNARMELKGLEVEINKAAEESK